MVRSLEGLFYSILRSVRHFSFFKNLLYPSGIRLGTDDMLRASYTPSPRRSSATPTPRGSSVTPNQKRKTTSSSKSKSSTPRGDKAARPRKSGAAEEQLNINTDNLLNIGGGATKRQRAQDFFMKPTDSS